METVAVPHKVIANKAGVGLSSISCYKGERVPEEPGPLERIYKVLDEEARTRDLRLPHSLPHLLALRTAATVERTDPDAAAQVLASLLRRPASEAWLRGRKRRLLHARRKAARLPVPAKVPVPRQTGDRHLAPAKHSAEIADYLRHVAAGRFRHAQFIAWMLGINLDAQEFPRAIASFRTAGAEEGIEAMLHAAADRDDIQLPIDIAVTLLEEGQVTDAQTILGAIRTATNP
ncbi:hypothetical protein GKQ77_16305 [Streptomyces sp. BG9H]|uniref:Uncharacterized protein n=1 Tax=Streptomyces anatolicus TaxID=2675858 RepID=A0ABS6YNV1_9ACTN|nr:hypothetical protein [Streptomyces anatolicus]MBW5423109.1 hypothetical protein [Streptomyces anatolicus]